MTSSSNWLREGEEEILAGFANKIGVFGGPGGQLILTNQRLLFTNRRKAKVLWGCESKDLVYVSPASNATIWTIAFVVGLLIRNAIKFTPKGGVSQRFVVTDRAQWIALVNERPSLKTS